MAGGSSCTTSNILAEPKCLEDGDIFTGSAQGSPEAFARNITSAFSVDQNNYICLLLSFKMPKPHPFEPVKKVL